jgi:hypothetical protein
MSSVVGGSLPALAGAASAVGSQVTWFIPMLVAAIAYFQYELLDPEARPINQESQNLLPFYDFIVVGGGSAGKPTNYGNSNL